MTQSLIASDVASCRRVGASMRIEAGQQSGGEAVTGLLLFSTSRVAAKGERQSPMFGNSSSNHLEDMLAVWLSEFGPGRDSGGAAVGKGRGRH